MKTAVIYARYSSDNQTEQSIEGQLRVCQDYAQRNDILILNTYIDRAMTGTNDNRPDFQQMIKDSEKKDFQYVIVYKTDRFSREKYALATYKKKLKDNGVKLLSATENIPDSPEGIILESVIEGMAEYYSAELSQKIRRGMNETRLKGNFAGGGIPYGYRVENRKFVIDEEKAEVVRFVFKQYSMGIFATEIVNKLTTKGILKNGRPFLPNTIYKILKNEKYTGIYKINNNVYENTYPQIIDKELFEKVNTKAKSNQYGKRSVKSTYILKNKLICGYCGKRISAESGISRNGNKINYYKCIGIKKYHNNCIKETVRQDLLENFITETVIQQLQKPKNIDIVIKNLLEIQDNNGNSNETLNMLNKSKQQAKTSLDNIMRAVEQGIINNTTNNRMKELENQIEEFEKQILIEKSKLSIKITEQDIRKFYIEALKKEPLELINYLVKEVKLYNDKMEIKFNTPLRSPDNKGFSFLSISKNMIKNMQFKVNTLMVEMQVDFYL